MPGCDPPRPSKGPETSNPGRPPNSPREPHKVAPGQRARGLRSGPSSPRNRTCVRQGSCAVLRAAARWHPPPSDRRWPFPTAAGPAAAAGLGSAQEEGRLSQKGRLARLREGGLPASCHRGRPELLLPHEGPPLRASSEFGSIDTSARHRPARVFPEGPQWPPAPGLAGLGL